MSREKSGLDISDDTHGGVEVLPREEQVEPVVQTLGRGNRLPGAARHDVVETRNPAGRNISFQTHLQSNLRSYGLNKRARVLPHLLLLRDGQFSSRLLAQVLDLLRREIRFVQFDGRDGDPDSGFCHLLWRGPRCAFRSSRGRSKNPSADRKSEAGG